MIGLHTSYSYMNTSSAGVTVPGTEAVFLLNR